MTKKSFYSVIGTAMVICIMAVSLVCESAGQVYAAEKACGHIKGENLTTVQYYGQQNSAKPSTSYFGVVDGKYMRVQYSDDENNSVFVEYYNQDFQREKLMKLPKELPLFGGFYDSGTHFYLITGQTNMEEDDDKEVFRVTKYDRNWNRIDSSGINGFDFGAIGVSTTVPFDAGNCDITSYKNYLYVRTAHEMYKDSYGINHQASYAFYMNMDTMEIIKHPYWSYISHSFNQFITMDGNSVVTADHGDSFSTRGIQLEITDVDENHMLSDYTASISVMKFKGESGDNYTGTTLGGLEVSTKAYIIAGSSVYHDDNWDIQKTKNIYVATVDKSTGAVKNTWITQYQEGSGCPGNPYLVKIRDDYFALLWMYQNQINYTFLNEKGEISSPIYTYDGELSDCAPIIEGDYLYWYTWSNNEILFYKLPVYQPTKLEHIYRVFNHDYERTAISGTYVTLQCKDCGVEESGQLNDLHPQWDYNHEEYYNTDPNVFDHKIGSILSMHNFRFGSSIIDPISTRTILELKDPSMGDVKAINFETTSITWKKNGVAEIFVYPEYGPEYGITYRVLVGPKIQISNQTIELEASYFTYDGKSKEPKVTIQGLAEGTDYSVSYENNRNVGTGKAVITGKGYYTGTVTKTFTIASKSSNESTMGTPQTPGSSVSPEDFDTSDEIEKIKLSKTSFVYNGKRRMPKVTVKNGLGEVLEKGKDYTVTYKNCTKVGKATVVIKGKGFYSGTFKKTYKIVPKAPISYKPKAAKKAVTVKWKKVTSQVTGYQVMVATNKNFTKNTKKVFVKGYKKTSYKVGNLKKKKTYYVKVRTYKSVNGVKYYSAWSKVKTCKTK